MVIESKHCTGVMFEGPCKRLCMSIHPEGKSCTDIIRRHQDLACIRRHQDLALPPLITVRALVLMTLLLGGASTTR